MGPAPLVPFKSAFQKSGTELPRGVRAPRPVTTTLRGDFAIKEAANMGEVLSSDGYVVANLLRRYDYDVFFRIGIKPPR
jgi:hypothetical protein